MKRRALVFLVAAASGGMLRPGFSQPRKQVKVGVLGPTALEKSIWSAPLVQRLAEMGYRDGGAMRLEYRASDGVEELYRQQARELIEAKCDLVYALGPEAPVRAMQDARAPMPIVFIAVDFDPMEKGIVADQRRPDRNTTGIYVPQAELVAKRLEILREIVPRGGSFLLLADRFSRDQLGPVRKSAAAAGVRLTVIEFTSSPYDFEAAFEAGRKAKADGYVGLASPALNQQRGAIAALLAKHQLPAVGSAGAQAEAGYLLSLGPDIGKTTRRAAEMGVRILKGTKTSEIPVEQADEFELAVNARTARNLAVKIPESVLARATRVIG